MASAVLQMAEWRTPCTPAAAAADARARTWMAAHDLSQRGAQGHSAVRSLREGARFAITEHSLYDGGRIGWG
jgi:uncharacterized protein involved in type VI secretion and phage assembly